MLEIKRRSRDQSRFALPVSAKMGVGILIMGAGFIVLAIAQGRAESLGKVGPQWLFFVYLLHTMGELCLSPIGLSLVSQVAPVRLAAVMMGIWFAANAIANYLAGILESLLAGSSIPCVLVSRRELARRRGIAALDHAAAQIPHAWQRVTRSV